MTDTPKLLTAQEAAAYLNVGRNQVLDAIHAGHLPIVQFGKSVRIPQPALDAWLLSAGGWQPPARPVNLAAERAKRRHKKRVAPRPQREPTLAERALLGRR